MRFQKLGEKEQLFIKTRTIIVHRTEDVIYLVRGEEGRGGEGWWGEGWGGDGRELKCYIQTDRQTYRTSDEAGPRGAFAPKNWDVAREIREISRIYFNWKPKSNKNIKKTYVHCFFWTRDTKRYLTLTKMHRKLSNKSEFFFEQY